MNTRLMLAALAIACQFPVWLVAQTDTGSDAKALPTVPAEFSIQFFAKEPLVRQPCSMAFDAKGRLFVGMGPQYRNPQPDTPGDSVVLVEDTDGDGIADKTKVFATGFNCIQGLAWHGNDLWVANSPDLTVVRDVDNDDEADRYVRLFTDLGNLEHGLHGLNWAPDGKLYMSKGNSKGLTKPNRIAPKPFRDLWGVTAPEGSPDFPEPVTFKKGAYQHQYQDPADDWGNEGGILRCDDGGKNLEIVARGMRNPWDLTMDDGFHWLGNDNDQTGGDRIYMPFYGAHFGWNHPWSSHWGLQPHAPTAPESGPLYEGSGTGMTFCNSPQFPASYQQVFLINDWLRKTTFKWTPTWEGALMKPKGGIWEPFIQGGNSLYRPTDLEFGPDGALWILGWGSGYGAEWKDGQLTNEGRIFRVASKQAKTPLWNSAKRALPIAQWTVSDLIDDFTGPLPIWRINAADELVRRGASVQADLMSALQSKQLTTMQETWTVWTLGRIDPKTDPAHTDATVTKYLTNLLAEQSTASLNLRIQAIRILAFRVREQGESNTLPKNLVAMLSHKNPRLRFAAVQAVVQARQQELTPALLQLLAIEPDRTIYYAAWQGLRALQSTTQLQLLLKAQNGGARAGVLLALLESNSLKNDQLATLAQDTDMATRQIASMRLNHATGISGGKRPEPTRTSAKAGTSRPTVASPDLNSTPAVSLIQDLQTKSTSAYRSQPGGVREGALVYTDRSYTLQQFPPALAGTELIQTANNDADSKKKADSKVNKWLTFQAIFGVRVHVAHDLRIKNPPAWLRENFRKTELKISTTDASFQLYSRDFPSGTIELGANTDSGKGGGQSNYFVLVEPLPLAEQPNPTTLEMGLGQLPKGDAKRGEILFKQVAGCAKCHSLTQQVNSFGPQLSDIGQRANPKHIVESIVQPDAHITEGFSQLLVESTDGKLYSGVLLEESGLSLTLGLSTAERVVLAKEKIETRKSTKKSAMPAFDRLLTPPLVADIAAFLMTQKARPAEIQNPENKKTGSEAMLPAMAANSPFALDLQSDRLVINHAGKPLAEYVFRDPKVLRPYFANLHGWNGMKISRNHPPIAGKDATDHDTMHPGLWLGFGDISGVDFWRNRGRIQHANFLAPPTATLDTIRFATESRLLTPDGQPMGTMVNRFVLSQRPAGWLLVWDATVTATERDLIFGDQEEMGFGARLATGLIETKGGQLLNSDGQKSAKGTWGKPAAWCDYSGTQDGRRIGITLMPAPSNFRTSWWHNRDYGVFVANPFGRAAMHQGTTSSVTVKKDQALRLVFGAVLHDSNTYDPASEFKHFLQQVK